MKINEIANMPYKLDINPTTSWGFDDRYYGSKSKEGATAQFVTDAGEKYEIAAMMIDRTREEKNATRELKKKREAQGKKFLRLSSKKGGIWEVAFTRTIESEHGQRDDDDDVSGTGDAFRVFATVMEFIEWLVKNRQPKYISIKSKAVESRKSLYRKLAQRYAPKLGYEISKIVDNAEGQRINLKQIKIIDRQLDPSEY